MASYTKVSEATYARNKGFTKGYNELERNPRPASRNPQNKTSKITIGRTYSEINILSLVHKKHNVVSKRYQRTKKTTELRMI